MGCPLIECSCAQHATAGSGWIRIFGRNFRDLSDAPSFSSASRLSPVQLQV